MVLCFAPDCNHYSETSSCKFFRFPSEDSKSKELGRWIQLIRRDDRNPVASSRICSCHFLNGNRENGPTVFHRNADKLFQFPSPQKCKKKKLNQAEVPDKQLQQQPDISKANEVLQPADSIHYQAESLIADLTAQLEIHRGYRSQYELKLSEMEATVLRLSRQCVTFDTVSGNDKLHEEEAASVSDSGPAFKPEQGDALVISDGEDMPCGYGEDDCVVIGKSSDDDDDNEQMMHDKSVKDEIQASETPGTETKTDAQLCVPSTSSEDHKTANSLANQHLKCIAKVEQSVIESATTTVSSKKAPSPVKIPYYSDLRACVQCGKLGVPDSFYTGIASPYPNKKCFCSKSCAHAASGCDPLRLLIKMKSPRIILPTSNAVVDGNPSSNALVVLPSSHPVAICNPGSNALAQPVSNSSSASSSKLQSTTSLNLRKSVMQMPLISNSPESNGSPQPMSSRSPKLNASRMLRMGGSSKADKSPQSVHTNNTKSSVLRQPLSNTNIKSNSLQQPITSSCSKSSAAPQTVPSTSCKANSTKRAGQSRTFDWKDYIQRENAVAASVSCFRHCPMSHCWKNDLFVGIKVEIPNTNTEISAYPVYWIAVVIDVHGYGAKVRYEGCEDDSSHDIWINLCSKEVHPIGWCSANVKPLVPPKFLQFKFCDWKEYLLERLTGSKTLPSNFHAKIVNSVKRCPLKEGMKLEVIDKMCLSTMSVATVEEVIGGRIKLRYLWSELGEDYFWCHSLSALIHPVGWSQHIGHKLRATPAYKTAMANKLTLRNFKENEARPELFHKVRTRLPLSSDGAHFERGMKLEAVDPLNLSTICVATIRKVLRNGYLMIAIDSYVTTPQKAPERRDDLFCYHMSSPYIFPVGFCQQHYLRLTLPKGCKLPFTWAEYLHSTNSVAAPEELFSKEIPKHSFKPGMKLEAVDLMDPKLICVATIVSVVGRLLKIHFDGWDNTYDQWMDCLSPDIYPLGWSDIVGHPLEGPLEVVTNRADRKRNKPKGRKRKKTRQSSSLAASLVQAGDETLSQSTDPSGDLSDSQSLAGSLLSSPVAKRLKIDVQKLHSTTMTSPEPPSLVELSPRCDRLPRLDLQTSLDDSTTVTRSMPNLLASTGRH